eukprot:3266537-Rhodomonas_salina.2
MLQTVSFQEVRDTPASRSQAEAVQCKPARLLRHQPLQQHRSSITIPALGSEGSVRSSTW